MVWRHTCHLRYKQVFPPYVKIGKLKDQSDTWQQRLNWLISLQLEANSFSSVPQPEGSHQGVLSLGRTAVIAARTVSWTGRVSMPMRFRYATHNVYYGIAQTAILEQKWTVPSWRGIFRVNTVSPSHWFSYLMVRSWKIANESYFIPMHYVLARMGLQAWASKTSSGRQRI